MAELNIKITTKYEDAEKGFNKVTGSVQKYRNELLKASQAGSVTDQQIQDYVDSLNKALAVEDKTKDGVKALSAQYKILSKELVNVGLGWDKNGDLYKKMEAALKQVKTEMTGLEKASANTAKKGMDPLEKSTGNFLTRIATLAKNILVFQLLLGPIRKAVSGVTDTIKESMQVAAEAEQVFNKLGTVFSGVESSANSMANALASSLGVAGSTAASALSTVGDLLQAQGMGTADSLSTASSWVSQFQDIIAFKDLNMSLEEFAQNFMSGAAGNLRNFRTFGSIVKESAVNAELAAKGLDKLTGSQLELAKMTARAEMALEQQANAMGATEREWDTMLSVNRRLNEAWKQYKENLGSALNEFIKPAKSWLTEILDYTNDVARALKEIEGGEFTVKVQQETSEEFLSRVQRLIMAAGPETNYKTPGSMSFWDRVAEAVGLASGATMNQIYSTGSLTSQAIADIMLATGATPDQMVLASEGSGASITKEQADAAQALVDAYWDLQETIKETKSELLSSAEAYDSFTESLATLPGIKGRSTNFTSAVQGLNEFNYDDNVDADWASAVSTLVSDTIKKMGSLGVGAFIDDIDKAFGLGDEQKAYQDWLNEIKDLYTILYNRQQQFGDVTDETLQSVIDMWKKVYDEMNAVNPVVATIDQKAVAQAKYGFQSNIRPLTDTSIYAEANAWRADQKTSLRETEAQLLALGVGASEVNAFIAEMIPLINEEYEAKKAEIDASIEAAEALKKLEAWAAVGDRALGSTGTVGGIIQSFQGEGDIWTKIVNAVLTILENTESWGEIAEILNQMFEMFEPVVESMLDLIVSLSPVWDVIVFCLKVIASAIVMIQGAVNSMLNAFKWLWENIKEAFRSLGQIIAHPIKAARGQLDLWNWYSLSDDPNKKTEQYLKEIWESVGSIERDTDAIAAGDLSVLEDLYSRGIINESQYNAGARVLQKDMVFDPVSARDTQYITGGATPTSTISYGGITLQFYGADLEEAKRMFLNILDGSGLSYDVAIGER